MLVLTRKMDETIVIDQQITVKVLRITGSRVRLGIEAPAEVSIRRREISREGEESFADDDEKSPEWAELDLGSLRL